MTPGILIVDTNINNVIKFTNKKITKDNMLNFYANIFMIKLDFKVNLDVQEAEITNKICHNVDICRYLDD